MILEERIIYFSIGRKGEKIDGDVTSRLERNEFGDGHELLEPCQAAWREVKLLNQNGFVHQTVPVYARFHVALPFVKVDVVTVVL